MINSLPVSTVAYFWNTSTFPPNCGRPAVGVRCMRVFVCASCVLFWLFTSAKAQCLPKVLRNLRAGDFNHPNTHLKDVHWLCECVFRCLRWCPYVCLFVWMCVFVCLCECLWQFVAFLPVEKWFDIRWLEVDLSLHLQRKIATIGGGTVSEDCFSCDHWRWLSVG